MKAVGVGAKVKGGEAGFLRGGQTLTTFEDQEFNGDFVKFRIRWKPRSKTPTPLVQTISVKALSRTTFLVREKGDTSVLVVSISSRRYRCTSNSFSRTRAADERPRGRREEDYARSNHSRSRMRSYHE
jgi:hypothetical protein